MAHNHIGKRFSFSSFMYPIDVSYIAYNLDQSYRNSKYNFIAECVYI